MRLPFSPNAYPEQQFWLLVQPTLNSSSGSWFSIHVSLGKGFHTQHLLCDARHRYKHSKRQHRY